MLTIASFIARSMKEEALKDLLEDSDVEDEHISNAKQGEAEAETSQYTTIHKDRTQGIRQSSHRSMTETSATASGRPHTTAAHFEKQATAACFISLLPPDLLMQCMEFLGDSISLCCVRAVSLGWLLVLDDKNAGRRLWRPLFYRLQADGSIHAATNTRGQRRRELKLYNLGPLGNDSNMHPSVATGSNATPSSTQTDAGPPLSCSVCGLIQRGGYSGNDCEMCASSLAPSLESSSAAPPRVAYTRLQLSQVSPRPTPLPVRLSKDDTASISPVTPDDTVRDGNSNGLPRKHGDVTLGGDGEEDIDVDWHFLVKSLAVEKRVGASWGSLHQGWVWLQGALQVS